MPRIEAARSQEETFRSREESFRRAEESFRKAGQWLPLVPDEGDLRREAREEEE